MEKARALMHQFLADPAAVYVFPSEIAAAGNMERTLQESDRAVVAKNKFISWDKFKADTLTLPPGMRPVDNCVRTIFITRLLEENAKTPLFRGLIREEFASGSPAYAGSLKRLLPHLGRSAEMLGARPDALGKEKAGDLFLLWTRYRDFLSSCNFRETGDSRREFSDQGKNYFIFYPEVIADFREICPLFEKNPRVRLHSVQSLDPGRPIPFRVYPAVKDEIRGVMLGIDRLLGQGVPPEDIVVTAAGLSRCAPLLITAAGLYDIRLRINEAKPLSSYPGVCFLRQINDITSSGWDYDALRALLQNNAPAWKPGLPIAPLLEFGLRNNCVRHYRENGKNIDIWEHQFRRLADAPEKPAALFQALSAFYRSLKTSIASIIQARSADALKQAVTRFTGIFFRNDDPDRDGSRFLQYALRVLDQLALTAALIPGGGGPVFPLWLSLLEETPYVRPHGETGIAVYPYRVSAGIMCRHHFVVNACESATRVSERPFPFLSADEEASLGLSETDSTEAFFALYRSSGENVHWSSSRQGFRTRELVPSFFLKQESTTEHDPEDADSYRDEECAAGKAGSASPERLYPAQQAGILQAALTEASGYETDFTRSPIEDPALRLMAAEASSDADGRLQISPTELELFHACPFRFLLEKAGKLKSRTAVFSQDDLRWFGSFIHGVFEDFFKSLQSADGLFRPDTPAQNRFALEESFRRIARLWEKQNALPVPPLWQAESERILDGFSRFLEIAAQAYGQVRVRNVENTFSLLDEEQGAILSGKIDLVLEDEQGTRILDYKTGRTPGKKDIFPGDKEPASFQIPFYVMLAEKNKLKPRSASYYSFKKESFVHIFGQPNARNMLGADEFEAAVTVMLEKTTAMANRIRQGDFTVRRSGGSCRDCAMRPVCRNDYLLEI